MPTHVVSLLICKIGFVYYASFIYYTSTYLPWIQSSRKCAGEEFAAISGVTIISSYLVLFISFYFATYKKAGQKGRKRSNTARKAVIDMSKSEVPMVDGTLSSDETVKVNGHAVASGISSNGSARSRKA